MLPFKPTIKVLLISANELRKDRDLFESMIARKNEFHALRNLPLIILEKWELSSHAAPLITTQDDFNKKIDTADIVVVLLWRKAGKYTLEEYDYAKKLHAKTGKPRIIIYKKNSLYVEDSLQQFLDQLKSIRGYLYPTYTEFWELSDQFMHEFERYMADHAATTPDRKKQFRNKLLEGLKKRYAKRFEKKLKPDRNFDLDLKLEYTKEGSDENFVKRYHIVNYEQKEAKVFNELFYEFESTLKRILILGEPGAGKTVLLLRFAQRLIEKAKSDINYPLPVIVNLASWRKECDSLETWLENNLTHAAGEYGTAKRYAKKLVAENNLLLLLDGLDEVPEPDRDSCLQKVWDYLRKNQNSNPNIMYYPQAIICSRTKEYAAIEANAPVQASLSIMPIEREAIICQLEMWSHQNMDSAKDLLKAIRLNPSLTANLTTAFDVNMALHLANRNLNHFTRKILIQEYVKDEIKKVKGMQSDKTLHYLESLAYTMEDVGKGIAFEHTDISGEWVAEKENKRYFFNLVPSSKLYSFTLELFRCVLLFSAFAVTLPFFPGLHSKFNIPSTAVAAILAVSISLLLAQINRNTNSKVIVKEADKFRFDKYTIPRFLNIFFFHFEGTFLLLCCGAFVFGLIKTLASLGPDNDIGLVLLNENPLSFVSQRIFSSLNLLSPPFYITSFIVTSAVLIYHNRKKLSNANPITFVHLRDIYKKKSARLILFYCFAGHLIGIGTLFLLLSSRYQQFFERFCNWGAKGLTMVVLIALISGLFFGFIKSIFPEQRLPKANKSYNRLFMSLAFNFLRISVPLTLIALILFYKDPNLFTILLLTQMISLVISLYSSYLLKYGAIRIALYWMGKAPLRYSTFLNNVAETGLMEKDGDQWRFRHQLIQDYLAGKEIE